MFLSGTYAELAICAPDQLHALPETATFWQGAALGIPYATAHRGMFHRAQAHRGEILLVHGASGAAIRVFGTAGSAKGCDLAHNLGADQVFDHNAQGKIVLIP